LEKRNQQLLTWRETALALSERLERYEALLNMPAEAYGVGANVKGAVSARLILDPGGPFKRTLLANAGVDHGVKRGFVAVNENGLVGRVVTLGKRSSRVLMLDDYNSHVPVMGLQSRARAMLNGDASREPKLTTGQVEFESPRLEHQVPEGRLREGERIVTSGDGGVFPRGVLVGFATRDGSGAWRVQLAAASKPIDFVRLVPYTAGETPEQAPVADAGPPPPEQRLTFAAPLIPPPPPPITARPAGPPTPPGENTDVAPDAPEPTTAAPAPDPPQ
jgi:rod shape-determining protein MreC